MLRRILKIAAWIFGSVIGVAIAFYLLVLFINRSDREPSATVLRFEEAYRNRPSVADNENAYIFILGIEAPHGDDPTQLGLQRAAWLKTPVEKRNANNSKDPLAELGGAKVERNPRYETFYKSCGRAAPDCRPTYDDLDHLKALLNEEHAFLARYQTLIEHSGWLEVATFNVADPIPPYARALDGQKLLLAQAMLLAHRNDVAGVNRLLSADLHFWRMALQSSDLLISKIFATVAMQRHFEVGNLVLRKLPPATVEKALPIEWRTPLSDAERSMTRAFVGEWVFTSTGLKNIPSETGESITTSDDDPKSFRVLSFLGLALYQPQDTINVATEHLALVTEAGSVPFEKLQESLRALDQKNAERFRDATMPTNLYNPVGDILAAIPAPDYSSYVVRVADLEGVRRAALAAAQLRTAETKEESVTTALAKHALRNPYNGEPFTWDEESKAIVFKGLEAGERGVYKFYY